MYEVLKERILEEYMIMEDSDFSMGYNSALEFVLEEIEELEKENN